jgi:predicted MFS family arabinose efflux permease
MLPRVNLGLRRAESQYIVARLSLMFSMDAFAGAFVMQTWIAFWFSARWGFSPDLIGYLLMGANVVAGASGIAAAHFVKRFGAMRTMIASHLPSNILLLAVPLMPTAASAAAMVVARFTISQMDVPARQAYVVSVVAKDEMSAAGGITGIARSLGMSLAPIILGWLSSAAVGDVASSPLFNAPWIISGVIKIIYDISLYGLYACGTGIRDAEKKAAEKDKAEGAKK